MMELIINEPEDLIRAFNTLHKNPASIIMIDIRDREDTSAEWINMVVSHNGGYMCLEQYVAANYFYGAYVYHDNTAVDLLKRIHDGYHDGTRFYLLKSFQEVAEFINERIPMENENE